MWVKLLKLNFGHMENNPFRFLQKLKASFLKTIEALVKAKGGKNTGKFDILLFRLLSNFLLNSWFLLFIEAEKGASCT